MVKVLIARAKKVSMRNFGIFNQDHDVLSERGRHHSSYFVLLITPYLAHPRTKTQKHVRLSGVHRGTATQRSPGSR
jgi:hypothetical protein